MKKCLNKFIATQEHVGIDEKLDDDEKDKREREREFEWCKRHGNIYKFKQKLFHTLQIKIKYFLLSLTSSTDIDEKYMGKEIYAFYLTTKFNFQSPIINNR